MNTRTKSNSVIDDVLTVLGAGAFIAVVVFGLLALLVVAEAIVIWVLWGWFVVPLGAPSITVAHAGGLALLLGAMSRVAKTGYEGDGWTWLGNVFMKYASVLTVGYVIKHYFM